VIGLLAVAAGCGGVPKPPPNRIVPEQFVARLATDALGRAPDQATWQRARDFFTGRGCTAATLKAWGREVYLGDAFAKLGYDDVDRSLVLYRGALGRDPDQPGSGVWEDRVDGVFDSHEFVDVLAPAICAPDNPASGAAMPKAPIALPTTGAGVAGDEAALQAQLNATPSGGTVALAQRALVMLDAPLEVPAGVTLTTTGGPGLDRYARMGRLARATVRDEPEVILGSGARLANVWVDGGRTWLSAFSRGAVDVRVAGDAATVESSRLTNALGGGTLFVMGPHYDVPCATATVRGNLITAYGSDHSGDWTDGISVACPRATVTGNAVVDATDVAIILYRVEGAAQASVVARNTVIAAGRSAFAALATDPLFDAGGQTFSFAGARFSDNVLWTGIRTHFDIGLAAGTREWFGGRSDKGTGAAFTGNTTGSLFIRSGNPIAVQGMLDATVQGNDLHALGMEAGGCAHHAVAASLADGWASGRIQGPVSDVALSGCITGGP
jgi:hypothetical protein